MMLAVIERQDSLLAAADRVMFNCKQLVGNYELKIQKLEEQNKLYEDIDLNKYATYNILVKDNKELIKTNEKLKKKVKFWKRMTVVVPVAVVGTLGYLLLK